MSSLVHPQFSHCLKDLFAPRMVEFMDDITNSGFKDKQELCHHYTKVYSYYTIQGTSRHFMLNKTLFRVPIFSSKAMYYSVRYLEHPIILKKIILGVFTHACSEGRINIINCSIFIYNF